ncbi:hypothetical protein [Achromobacter phage Motura]|uniref:Uncharacterized protein n=1 Tax=Achromobacter phage Motura TaxID=2591403 RepID=A0A514CT37_9CAUD|nr:hypothetical protein H1O15_gp156 [Achromobacter phage Motura]QDH83632.1 hypothetical protein [Achromobacter phage Motura]
MPFYSANRTNNRVLPANARAVDNAKQALEGIVDVQQRRYLAAFQVQGYDGILYQRMHSGKNCSCQGAGAIVNTILDREGKASKGTINELLTGKDFGVRPYGAEVFDQPVDQVLSPFKVTQTSPNGGEKFRGNTYDIGSHGGEYPNELVMTEGMNDNGNLTEFDFDEVIADFDQNTLGSTDYACPICFGTGFIGGYIPTNAVRTIVTPQDVEFGSQGYLDESKRPFIGYGSFEVRVVLPRLVIHMDSITLFNYDQKKGFDLYVDSVKVNSAPHLVTMCDGKPHVLRVVPKSTQREDPEAEAWTHLELQFNTSQTSMWFEFPRLTDGNDISKLDQTEPFQIVLSPNIVAVSSEDIITDSTYGKHYIVQGTPIWNTRNRKTLGWETNVRVLQPGEPQRLLPVRGRIPTKNRTTVEVRDNSRGPYRT